MMTRAWCSSLNLQCTNSALMLGKRLVQWCAYRLHTVAGCVLHAISTLSQGSSTSLEMTTLANCHQQNAVLPKSLHYPSNRTHPTTKCVWITAGFHHGQVKLTVDRISSHRGSTSLNTYQAVAAAAAAVAVQPGTVAESGLQWAAAAAVFVAVTAMMGRQAKHTFSWK